VPEKSGGFAAAAANATAKKSKTILRIILVFSLRSIRSNELRTQLRSVLSCVFSSLSHVLW
jgi:hypothetical protein